MIAIAMLAVLLNMVFVLVIKSNFLIGERRFFLENKNHPKTRFGRLFFLFNERNYINPAIVMFMKNLFFALWSLTIAGMFIKQYSYRLVPFIMAENPDIKWKDAITLSRKMMNGNKWRTFVFDLSFWYWYLLKFITAGLVGVFFFNPYFTAAETELYAAIRAESYERGIENIELLNDESLYVRTDNEEYPLHLVSKHADVDEKKWDRSYSFVNLVLIFFTCAFIGCGPSSCGRSCICKQRYHVRPLAADLWGWRHDGAGRSEKVQRKAYTDIPSDLYSVRDSRICNQLVS